MNVLDRLPPGSRIAVIRLRSLGDCVLTTPALSLLKLHRPDLKISVIVEPRFSEIFAANPDIDLVVLRNSHGGDAGTGYEIGEFFRERGVTTAVSGYCVSSCSRMFLGGKRRLFTDDYPLDQTRVG